MVREKIHFMGFAKLLLREIDITIARCQTEMQHGVLYSKNDIFREIEQVIAQRASDLVYHTLAQVPALLDCQDIESAVRAIPDLTRWPDEDVEQAETISMPLVPPSRMEEEAG